MCDQNLSFASLQHSSNEICLEHFEIFLEKAKLLTPTDFRKTFSIILENIKAPYVLLKDSTDFEEVLNFYKQNFLNQSQSPTKLCAKKKWKSPEITILAWVLANYTLMSRKDFDNFNTEDWKDIAKMIPKWNAEKIRFKWFSIQKSIEQKVGWSSEEDQRLAEIIFQRQQMGMPSANIYKWTDIAEELNKTSSLDNKTRLGKHCRERWFNHLDPTFKKGEWTNEEDYQLMKLIVKNGKKWSMISRIIGSRNENSVKNRFFALKRKFIKSYKQIPQSEKKMIIFIADKLQAKIKPGKKGSFAAENSPKSENLDEDDEIMDFSFEKPSKKMKIKIERKKRELTVEIKKPSKSHAIEDNKSFNSPFMHDAQENDTFNPSYNPSYNLASTEIIDTPFTNLFPGYAANQTPLTLSTFHPRNEHKTNKNQENYEKNEENNNINQDNDMPQPKPRHRRSPLKSQTYVPVSSPKEYNDDNKEIDDMSLLYLPNNINFNGEDLYGGQQLQTNMCFYQIPNMYKAFQREPHNIDMKKPVKLYPNKEILDIMKLPFDIINEDQNDDDASKELSQFLSSMSLSDQYIHESNRILSGLNLNANSLNSSSKILTESFQRSNSKHHTVTITHSSQRSSYLDNTSPFINSMVTPRNYNINSSANNGNSFRDTLNNCNNSNNFILNGNMNNVNNLSGFQRINNKKITLVPSCESVVAIRKEKKDELDSFIENNYERNESELSLGQEYLGEYRKE